MNDLNRSYQRFLEDLRSGSDRRSWDERRQEERRGEQQEIDRERRTDDDRRVTDRRDDRDRRSPRFFAFTERERLEIHAMLRDAEASVACPRCGGHLLLSVPDEDPGTDVICLGCRGRMHLAPGQWLRGSI